MRFRRNELLSYIIGIAIALFVFNGALFAQFDLDVTGPTSNLQAPTSYDVTVEIDNYAAPPDSIVFYRNDVPVKTVDNPSDIEVLDQDNIGEDTYTYRVRAYTSSGDFKDSNDFKLIVETKYVFVMGKGLLQPAPSPGPPQPITIGPDRFEDHTDDIIAAIEYLDDIGGGTLYFPCSGGPATDYRPDGDLSIYNIRDTITIPSNVTLQGESAEEGVGRCRIYWRDAREKGDDPEPPDGKVEGPACYESSISSLSNKPMFLIEGNTDNVRFRDLWFYSRSSGWACDRRYDWQVIDDENTVAFAMYGSNGNISDVIFENVSVSNFTYGIKATTCINAQAVGSHFDSNDEPAGAACDGTNYEISDIKMRGVRPYGNFRQLYINGKYVYDWDVQNFNMTGMLNNQGAVEIVKAGAPLSAPNLNKKLRFLELNCNGGNANLEYEFKPFCVEITRHGGLYFKLTHAEAVKNSFKVNDIGTDVNSEPIILESGVTDGEFLDDSMKLYLIGNGIVTAPDPETAVNAPHPDRSRIKFSGAGLQSTVEDCGDVHWDMTDVNWNQDQDEDPPHQTTYSDWQMQYTHSERNRSSFFGESYGYSYVKKHKVCSPNINQFGGEHFNTGVMPNLPEVPVPGNPDFRVAYSSPFECTAVAAICTAALENILDDEIEYGTIYIKGTVRVNKQIRIPSGRQIVGAPGAEILLVDPNCTSSPCPIEELPQSLFHIEPGIFGARTSGIVIRNLKLKSDISAKTASGILIAEPTGDDIGISSDLHFSGLVIEGFKKGLEVTFNGHQPMIDGVSWKDIKFINNQTAAGIFSSRLSNWNVMDLKMESMDEDAVGWDQTLAGSSLQNVSCRATGIHQMEHCLKLYLSGGYLTGLKRTENVTNSLTLWYNYGMPFGYPYVSVQFTSLILRNNDFRSSTGGSGKFNLIGKTYIVSMDNKYENFDIDTSNGGSFSRLTHCGDAVENNDPYFPDLENDHPNNYVGVPTPTKINCAAARPVPWEDAINWGGEDVNAQYQPLSGRFFDENDDYIVYKKGVTGEFRIRKAGAATIPDSSNTKIIPWGTTGDRPMIGRLLPGEGSQVVIWRPSNGQWWVKDPDQSISHVFNWGLSCAYSPNQTGYEDCDIPIIGNFLPDPNSSEDLDEIAIYRPTNNTFYIYDPRNLSAYTAVTTGDYGSQLQVGDFWGAGYDQIAQIDGGSWTLFDFRTSNDETYTFSGDSSSDVPVAGNYLSDDCTEIAVWRPNDQKFLIRSSPASGCTASQSKDFYWGSNNEFGTTGQYQDDIPLRVRTDTGSGIVDRPALYRPTNGVFTKSTSRGRWWIHDSF